MRHLTTTLLISCSFAAAAPQLTSQYRLSPESETRVVFDNAMIAKESVGTTQENTLLNFQPALKGRILWHSENVAIFQPLEPASLNTTYIISTKAGLADTTGKAIPKTNLGKKSTHAFEIRRSRQLSSASSVKRPATFLCFTDDISPRSLSPYFFYQSKEGNRSAAQITQATFGDINSTYYAQTSWSQRFQFAINKSLGIENPKIKLKKDTVLPNCIMVRPIDTLPAGTHWTLHSMKGIPNKSKNTKIVQSDSFSAGSKNKFAHTKSTAATVPNEPRFLRLTFNSKVQENLTQQQLQELVKITPAIPDLKFTISGSRIDLHGNFYKQDNYNINILRSLMANNGLSLSKAYSERVQFEHIEASMAIPTYSNAQLAKGQRKYPIETVNMQSVRVRVKTLTKEQAIRSYQGFNEFLEGQVQGNNNRATKRVPLPYSLINGKVIHDQSYQLDNKIDTSKTLVLEWDKILPQDRKNLIFFLDVEGVPKQGTDAALHNVQSFLQLTDIGLAWKISGDDTFLYCYSCDTGKPLGQVELQTYSADAELQTTLKSNQDGIVKLPASKKASHLVATLGGDSYIIPINEQMNTVGLWRFPVKYHWYTLDGWQREALIFTDRKLYKPGEKAHIKGIVRERRDNVHRVPEQRKATLSILDPADRILVEQEITISDNGTFDHTMDLPSSNLGSYQIRLEFKIPEDKLAEDENDDDQWERNWLLRRNSTFTSYFSVQEFRRNAFKVANTLTAKENQKLSLTAKVNANYYMGTAVAKGKLDWYLTVTDSGFYPEKFREYYFGNHLKYDPYYWDYYYGYDDGNYYDDKDSKRQNGSLDLSDEGLASFDLTIEAASFPSPQKVKLIAEVTDGREQTLTDTSYLTLHPSSHYIGIGRIDKLLKVGQANELNFLAVTNKGQASKLDMEATVTINRITYDSVKVRSGDGRVTIDNNKKEELFTTHKVQLLAGKPFSLPFMPTKAGRYTVTVDAKDAEGNKISSATRLRVYGSNEYSWSVNTGMKIELAPEQKNYKPGDTARILVKTPIEGTALVTVERNKVMRHYLRELTTSNPIIEVPLEHQDAPNVYVSVLLIRGASESPLKYKEPALRLGYCNLTVENQIDKLNVSLDSPLESYRPGEAITLSGTITDYKNRPVANGEVTFFGEDNGVLDVIGYKMPRPLKYFNKQIALTVETGTSLDTFLQEMAAEDMDMINHSVLNKGYTIGGGGGEMSEIKKKIRKNFDPCAFWKPSLKTDANGKFTVTFTAPETLTSYRLMAVAVAGPEQFGSAKSEIVINKPLMLEPLAPRFANEGDTTRTKLYVANNSKFEGQWKITLKTNSLSTVIGGTDNHIATRMVDLKPGASVYLNFDTKHTNTGQAKWTWSAQPTKLISRELTPHLQQSLSDAMETKFNILYPRPILKGARFRKLNNNQQDLLAGIDPNLFEGRGRVELEFCNNLLFKARGAADHLLHYPYG